MKKVYVEGCDGLLVSMFEEEGWEVVNDLFVADLLCLEGGADVSPELYGQENTHSYVSRKKDIVSFGLITVAERLGIPIVGVCRGGQILNVYLGGKMHQDIPNHAIGVRTHQILVRGEMYNCCSAHHQGMITPYVEGEEVFHSQDGNTEIIIHSGGKHLSFQPHPEYHPEGHECRTLFFSLVEEIM